MTPRYLTFASNTRQSDEVTIMSTDDASPVPDAPDGTSINVEGSIDPSVDNFVDNYELLGAGDGCNNFDKYSLSDQMVHFCGGQILRVHLTACKAVIAFYAGSSVSKLSQMTKKLREAACLRIYLNAVDELDDVHFDSDAKDFFRSSFLKSNDPLLGASLYRYYLDSRCKIRNHLLPLFPKDLVKMKSGHGFHESCNSVYVTGYRHEMASLKKTEYQDTPRQKLLRCFRLPIGNIRNPLGILALSSKFFVAILN